MRQGRPEPWSEPTVALEFVDPQLLERFGVEMIRELLATAQGEVVTTCRQLDDDQLDLLRRHRVEPLIPKSWELPASYGPSSNMELDLLDMSLAALSKRVVAALAGEGIPALVLKGLATSRLDYHDHRLRHSGDIDLLVGSTDLRQAVSAVEALGFKLILPDFDDEFVKGMTLVGPGGVEVDLHTRLSNYSDQPAEMFFEGSVRIADLEAAAPGIEARLVHAATHLYLTNPGARRLSGLADIGAIRQGSPDLKVTRDLAARLGLEGPVFGGLAVEAAISGRPLSDLAQWQRPDWFWQLAFGRARRLPPAEQFLRLRLLERGTRVRYVRQKLIPPKSALDRRGGWLRYASRGLPAALTRPFRSRE